MAALEVTDSAGALVATVTNPLTVRTTDRASALGEMVCTVYVGSPGAASVTPGAYLRWTDDSYSFWGIVEKVTRAEQEDGSAILTVTAIDIAREMALLTLGPTMFSVGSTPWALQAALDLLTLDAVGWTVTAAADVVSETVYLAADGASQWTMLLSIADKLGAWVIRGAGRTCTLTRNFTASGVTARSVSGDKPANVAALITLQNTQDLSEVVNHVYPFSAGNAAARLDLNMASAGAPSGLTRITTTFLNGDGTSEQWYGLRHFGSFSTYGKRQRVVQFPDISPLSNSLPDITNAANALQAAAGRYLLDHALPQRALQLTMDDAPSIVSPGKTLHVTEGDIDGDFRVLEASHAWAPNVTVRSSLSLVDSGRAPATGAGESVRAMEAARVYRAHAQLSANVYQLSYTKPVDAQYGADFRFRFDEGITQVLFVALDVKLAPLESTVRAIGASGVKTSAYTYGGHVHSTTFAGHTHFAGDHTHTYAITLPAHTHNIRFVSVTSADTAMVVQLNVGASTTPTGLFYRASGGGTNTDFPTQSTGSGSTGTGNTGATGAATVTSSGLVGSFNTSSDGGFTHDHTVDVTVTMEYGIYRDSAANTFAVADLEYQINSGAWAALSGATSLGDGWYRLPLTNALVDLNTFYPLNKSNKVTVRAVAISAAEETFAVQATGASTYVWNDAGTLVQTLAGTVATAIALSANRWLYRLTKSDGTIRAYQPDATGTLVLWATFVVTINQYNAICVDARTGEKWVAGDSGSIVRVPDNLASVISGTPTLVAVAAIGGNVYARSTGTLYRMNTNAPTWPVTNTSIAGVGLAARNDGRVVTTSTTAAAFTLRVFESDLSASVNCVRSDAGNAWTPLSLASGANLVHVGCSDGRVRTYSLDLVALTATLVWTSTGTPGTTGYPAAVNLLAVSAALSSKAAMIDAQLTVRSVVQAIVMN